jgi:hypothetical protein
MKTLCTLLILLVLTAAVFILRPDPAVSTARKNLEPARAIASIPETEIKETSKFVVKPNADLSKNDLSSLAQNPELAKAFDQILRTQSEDQMIRLMHGALPEEDLKIIFPLLHFQKKLGTQDPETEARNAKLLNELNRTLETMDPMRSTAMLMRAAEALQDQNEETSKEFEFEVRRMNLMVDQISEKTPLLYQKRLGMIRHNLSHLQTTDEIRAFQMLRPIAMKDPGLRMEIQMQIQMRERRNLQ